MNLEIMLFYLNDKFPCLRSILYSEFAPYLTIIIAVLIGWLITFWIFHLIWMLFTPLAISVIVITLMHPATSKWYFEYLGSNLETAVNGFMNLFQNNSIHRLMPR